MQKVCEACLPVELLTILLMCLLLPPADALKKAKSQASGSDISDVASDAKDKAKGLLKGKGISALPGSNPLAAVADLNRDVHGDAEDYRDPAGAVQQDNAAGGAC
jgi:hypothetical protein